MLAAAIAGTAGVAGAAGIAGTPGAVATPCPEAEGEAGLFPGTDPEAGCREGAALCVALRRSTCRELAELTSAPVIACAAPTVAPPPRAAVDIAPPLAAPRAPAAIAVLPFAPKTSPPVA